MSRIRSIKPEFWTSAQIMECSIASRLLFIGLWNFCDDDGRHPWNARQAKAEVFPSDDFSEDQILGMLLELSSNGLIVGYSHDGKNYFYVTGWTKHQRIDKPQKSKYPDPFHERSSNTLGTFPPDTIGEDRKGKDNAAGSPSAHLKLISDSPPEQLKDRQPIYGASQEKALFERGKEICGQNAGGLIAKLLKAKGGVVAEARAAIELASTKQSPREYIGAVARGQSDDNGGEVGYRGHPYEVVRNGKKTWAF